MISNCKGCSMQNKDPEKDRRTLEDGYYIVSKVYRTTLNPQGIIMGNFADIEKAKQHYNKFTFLRRMLDPKLIKIENGEIKI